MLKNKVALEPSEHPGEHPRGSQARRALGPWLGRRLPPPSQGALRLGQLCWVWELGWLLISPYPISLYSIAFAFPREKLCIWDSKKIRRNYHNKVSDFQG